MFDCRIARQTEQKYLNASTCSIHHATFFVNHSLPWFVHFFLVYMQKFWWFESDESWFVSVGWFRVDQSGSDCHQQFFLTRFPYCTIWDARCRMIPVITRIKRLNIHFCWTRWLKKDKKTKMSHFPLAGLSSTSLWKESAALKILTESYHGNKNA